MAQTKSGKNGKKGVSPWANRIVASGVVAPGKLLANPANWRKHSKAQAEAMVGVLGEIGWVQKTLVNRRTGHILDGHLRVEQAMKKGEAGVPVDYVDVSIKEEKKILLTLNALGEMAGRDANALESLLREVKFLDKGVESVLADLAESIDMDREAPEEKAEVGFTEELLEEHNFVVLYFDNEVDWINLQSILELKPVQALHSRKGFMSAGVGRVVKGPDAVKMIQAAPEFGDERKERRR